MMDCTTTKEYIDLYIDQRLSDVQTNQLLLHVENCESCRAEFDDAMVLRSAFDNLDDIEPPAGLAASAIKKAKKSKVPVFAFATAGVAAAAMLIAMFSTGVIGGPRYETMDMAKNESVAYSDAAADEPMDAAADFAPAADMAEEETMMESFAADEDAAYDVADDMAADDIAEDASADDGVQMAGMPPSVIVFVPPNSADVFRQSIDEFLAEYDIAVEYVSSNGMGEMTFIVDETSFDDFEALITGSGVRIEGDLYPGAYISIMFDIE